MNKRVRELLEEARGLTPTERAQLVDEILALDQAGASIEDAWAVEIKRRLKRARSGESPGVDLDVALERIQSRFKSK